MLTSQYSGKLGYYHDCWSLICASPNHQQPWYWLCRIDGSLARSQYPKRRPFVRSRFVSTPRDWYFKLSYRFEICQAHRQHCCRSACQISERSDNSKYKSRGFETLRDLTERRLFGYWDGAQVFCKAGLKLTHLHLNKMATIVAEYIFKCNAFHWIKMIKFRFKFHWNFLTGVQWTINQHWFRLWLGAEETTSHYLNQWWPISLTHICGTGGGVGGDEVI